VARGPQCSADFLARASRSAVRFFAAAREAVFARELRSFGVMFFADTLPPSLPNWREISVMAARISGGIFTLMPAIVHLTGYGEDSAGKLIQSDPLHTLGSFPAR